MTSCRPLQKEDPSAMKAMQNTVYDFAGNTTVHGIGYIFDRAIKLIDRILWLLVVLIGIALAVYMSLDAWFAWKSAPVLTSVSSTGLPLSKIEFPAITICSQGVIQDVLDKALTKQFKDYLESQGLDYDSMTQEQLDEKYKGYNQDLYPGSTTSPKSMVNVLVADNPTETIKSKVLTDPSSTCVDVPPECEDPWFEAKATESMLQRDDVEYCFANLGQTSGKDDLCTENGGSTIYFSMDGYGTQGEFLGHMLTQGEWTSVNFSSFWFNAFLEGNITYTVDGDMMTSLSEFAPAYANWNGTEDLDPTKQYCTTAFLHQYYAPKQYEYKLVDCDDPNIKAYRLCFREPRNCSAIENQELPTRRKKRQTPSGSLDGVFVPQKKIQRDNQAREARISFTSNFKKMNLEKSYPSLFEILWYTQLPCFDVEDVTSGENHQYGMLKACFWKGLQIPCSKVFNTFPTDQGMCCTFNMQSAEDLFKASKYRDMVDFMQKRDRNLSFDGHMKLPEDFLRSMVSESGRSKGLQLVLDAHSDLLSGGSVPEDFDGFYAIIDAKDQYPMTTRKSVLIKPGSNNFVSMSATKISALKSIESIDKTDRNCMFNEEMDMNVFQNYSQGNCMLECQLKYGLSKMNASDPCIPWYFPIKNNETARLCDPWEAREFRLHMSRIPFDKCDYCLPDCSGTIYSASVTSAPFRRCDYKNLGVSFLCDFEENIQPPIWGKPVRDQYELESYDKTVPEYIDKLVKSNQRLYVDSRASGNAIFKARNDEVKSYDAYEKDIAMVTFFFETNTVFEYTRDERMTLIGYISQMGGLLGLCLGFSLISGVEIVYWFTIRLLRNM